MNRSTFLHSHFTLINYTSTQFPSTEIVFMGDNIITATIQNKRTKFLPWHRIESRIFEKRLCNSVTAAKHTGQVPGNTGC